MKRILITGMSATGKSTLVRELTARNYKAIDLDTDEWSQWVEVDFDGDPSSPEAPAGPGRDWVWREDRVRDLLDLEDAEILFLSGCAENMRMFLTRFDRIILLTVPDDVLIKRLAARKACSYGSRPDEATRVLGLVRTIEPRLRLVADFVIDTGDPPDQTLSEILRHLDYEK